MKKLLLLLASTCALFVESSAQTSSKSEIIDRVTMPIYNLKIQSASPYEVSINDILIDYHYDSGAVDYDIDINQWILNSDIVKFQAKIFPSIRNSKSNIVDKLISDYFKISLFVYEKENKNETQVLLQEFKFSLQKKDLEIVNECWEVELNVPYQLQGWKDSENLLNQDKDSLLSEIIEVYSKIAKSINEGNIIQYNNFFRKADKEYFLSMYSNESEMNETMSNTSKIVNMSRNKTIFSNIYDINFYANSQIVTLEKNIENLRCLLI